MGAGLLQKVQGHGASPSHQGHCKASVRARPRVGPDLRAVASGSHQPREALACSRSSCPWLTVSDEHKLDTDPGTRLCSTTHQLEQVPRGLS